MKEKTKPVEKPLPHSPSALADTVSGLTQTIRRNASALKDSRGANPKSRIALEHAINRRAVALECLSQKDPARAAVLISIIQKGGVL